MRDWTDVGFSSIYYLLNKMDKAGLVEGRRDASMSRGPTRKVYSPTTEGLIAWTEASLGALATPHTKMPLLLGLAGLGALPEDRALDAARACLQALEERLQGLVERRWPAEQNEWFVEEALDYSEQSLRFGRDWLAGFVERFEQRKRGGLHA